MKGQLGPMSLPLVDRIIDIVSFSVWVQRRGCKTYNLQKGAHTLCGTVRILEEAGTKHFC